MKRKYIPIFALLFLSACASVPEKLKSEPHLLITTYCEREVSRLAISDDGTLLFVLSDDYGLSGVKEFINKVIAQLAVAGRRIKVDQIDRRLNIKCGVHT